MRKNAQNDRKKIIVVNVVLSVVWLVWQKEKLKAVWIQGKNSLGLSFVSTTKRSLFDNNCQNHTGTLSMWTEPKSIESIERHSTLV